MSGAGSGDVSTNKKAWNWVFEPRLYKLEVVFDQTHSLQVHYRKGKEKIVFAFVFLMKS